MSVVKCSMTSQSIKPQSTEEAAAILVEESLTKMGTILDVGRENNIVSFTTSSDGVHLMNIQNNFDLDIHLICEADEVKSGSLKDSISKNATVYVNMVVHGLSDEYVGYGMPTHTSEKNGSNPRDESELNDVIVECARILDIEIF